MTQHTLNGSPPRCKDFETWRAAAIDYHTHALAILLSPTLQRDDLPLTVLELNRHTYSILARRGITTIGQAKVWIASGEWRVCKGMGSRRMAELVTRIQDFDSEWC